MNMSRSFDGKKGVALYLLLLLGFYYDYCCYFYSTLFLHKGEGINHKVNKKITSKIASFYEGH